MFAFRSRSISERVALNEKGQKSDSHIMVGEAVSEGPQKKVFGGF